MGLERKRRTQEVLYTGLSTEATGGNSGMVIRNKSLWTIGNFATSVVIYNVLIVSPVTKDGST